MIENEEVEMILMTLEEKSEKTISVTKEDFSTIRAGRANPHILDKIQVEAYGGTSPLVQLGNVSVLDAKCLMISPWDKSLLKAIEKAILQSNIGLTPTNDGKVIRLVFPDLTTERRKELVKTIKKMGEEAKVAERNNRREAMDGIKKLKTGKAISEDDAALCEKEVEKTVSECIAKIEELITLKEKEIMTV